MIKGKFYLILILLLFSLPYSTNLTVAKTIRKSKSAERIVSPSAFYTGAFYINGNSEFATVASARGWQGDGSKSNPYLIQSFSIDGFGSGTGIFIANTSVYFHVFNISISHLSYAVHLVNVSHGELLNISYRQISLSPAIYLQNSREISINGTDGLSSVVGIEVQSSSNITFTNNMFDGGGFRIKSVSNLIMNKNFVHYAKYGVYATDSKSLFFNFTVIWYSEIAGFKLYNCSNSLLSNNTVFNTQLDSYRIKLSHNTTFISDVADFAVNGFVALNSSYTSFIGCTSKRNTLTISARSVSTAVLVGFYLNNSDYSFFRNNLAFKNIKEGFLVDNSPHLTMENNTASTNGDGFVVLSSNSSKITHNLSYNSTFSEFTAIYNYNLDFSFNQANTNPNGLLSTRYEVFHNPSSTYRLNRLFKNGISGDRYTLNYIEGISGNNLSFVFMDDFATNYSLYNGKNMLYTKAWTNGVMVNVSFDGYRGGSYNFTIVFRDGYGSNLTIPVHLIVIDLTAPAQVLGLLASPLSTTSIQISWNPSTAQDFSHYNIYRSGIFINRTKSTYYIDTHLNMTTSYAYQITAVDKAGNEGMKSFAISVMTLSPDTTPPTITILSPIGTVYDPLNITVISADNVKVASVNYRIDGGGWSKLIQKSALIWAVILNKNTIKAGNHTLLIKSIDTSGNVAYGVRTFELRINNTTNVSISPSSKVNGGSFVPIQISSVLIALVAVFLIERKRR